MSFLNYDVFNGVIHVQTKWHETGWSKPEDLPPIDALGNSENRSLV